MGASACRVRWRAMRLPILLPLAVLFAAGCWRPAAPPEHEPAPEPEMTEEASGLVQEKIDLPEIKDIAKPKEKPVPKAESPDEAAQQESAPLAAASTEEKPAAPKAATPRITPEQLASISVGMSLDDVQKAMGLQAETISSNDVSSAILKWTDEAGRSLVAKFEDGELVRKSIFDPVGAAEEKANAGPKITQELYDGIAPGMTVGEVEHVLGLDGRPIAEGRENIVIYKWVDGAGSNFTAKFEGGALVHKTGFYVSPLKDEQKGAPSESEESDTPEAEPAEEGEAPAEPAGASREATPPAAPPAAEPAIEPPPVTVPQVTSVKPQRVRVAGAARREREAATRDPDEPTGSYKPKAKLPDYTWTLRRGAYEVRVHNPTGSRVRVGLRAGRGGKDVSIPPGGTQSFHVDRANYELFYVFDDAPYRLHRGSGIVLDGFFYGDIEITLFDESYDIRAIDYALE